MEYAENNEILLGKNATIYETAQNSCQIVLFLRDFFTFIEFIVRVI